MPITQAYRNYLAQASLGEAVTAFNAANAHIGVGNSSTAFANTQTDLLGGANTLRRPMDGGFPTRNVNAMTFQATFGTAQANFAWNEWGIFNAAAGNVMMNRVVESIGTKTSSMSWQLNVTATLNI